MPGAFEDYVKDFLDPKVPWHQISCDSTPEIRLSLTYNWSTTIEEDDRSKDVYLPSEQPEDGISKAVVVKDTERINQFIILSCCNSLVVKYPPC